MSFPAGRLGNVPCMLKGAPIAIIMVMSIVAHRFLISYLRIAGIFMLGRKIWEAALHHATRPPEVGEIWPPYAGGK